MEVRLQDGEVLPEPDIYPVLGRLDVANPECVKDLTMEELELVAGEIRQMIVKTVTENGGHLASPLGVVELTLALWHVFDMGRDRMVWDVGHQSYAHKILSGRRDAFCTLRRKNGLSGYPRRSESRYDAFGTGHSSTSISAALGMAVARDSRKDDYRVIALIGDGAISGGMALEALNHAGHLGRDMLVILNDNEMSIARNVGALSQYFSRMITARQYKRAKEDVTSFVKRLLGPRLSLTAHRLEASVKGFLTAGGFFQELGFNYVGPVDGHDLPVLVNLLSNIKEMHGPVLLHCATVKGKGYEEAENDPLKYHGVSPRRVEVELDGEARPPEKISPRIREKTFTDVFADALIEAAEIDPRIVAITAAMPTGTGLHRFQQRFPDRCFDVGICEQHAVTFAAGLAADGARPVCAIYSTFLQRGFDQVIHDVCLQRLPVVFAVDRAGLVGEDSPTHAGSFDLSYLRMAPNLEVFAPRDGVDLREMLLYAVGRPGPVAIRYPRDTAPTIGPVERGAVTRGEILRAGTDATLLAVGPSVGTCLCAAAILDTQGCSVGVADARVVKPLDGELLAALLPLPLITVEENVLAGGFGAAVAEHYEQAGVLDRARICRIGLPDAFPEHMRRWEQLTEYGLTADGIASRVNEFVHRLHR